MGCPLEARGCVWVSTLAGSTARASRSTSLGLQLGVHGGVSRSGPRPGALCLVCYATSLGLYVFTYKWNIPDGPRQESQPTTSPQTLS